METGKMNSDVFFHMNLSISNGNLTSAYRAAAVKTCTNNETGSSMFGGILGHQVGMANY